MTKPATRKKAGKPDGKQWVYMFDDLEAVEAYLQPKSLG